MGVCPAASLTEVDGLNFGQNGGRACWAIAGTFCQGQVQGTFALKMDTCLKCVFYQRVKQEEGPQFLDVEEILKVIYAYC